MNPPANAVSEHGQNLIMPGVRVTALFMESRR